MKIISNNSGFTFVEVMVAVVIVSIAAYGLMIGAVHARGELNSLKLKERATEELINYLEYWKGRVAHGKITHYEMGGNPGGEKIDLRVDPSSDVTVEAKRFYDIDYLEPAGPKYKDGFKRYRLEVWIRWPDFSTGKEVTRERRMEMVMTSFKL